MKKISIGKYSKLNNKASFTKPDLAPTSPLTMSASSKRKKAGKSRLKRIFSFKTFFIFFIFAFIVFLGFGYYRIQVLGSRVEKYDSEGNRITCNNLLNPDCWTEAFKPQLKQTSGYTNILIVGLDTRGKGSGLLNTDTIMVASFNHDTEQTMLISIPRDLYVTDYGYNTRINSIYAFTGNKKPEDPFYYLKEVITNITDLPIHYTVTVYLQGVIDGIDKMGGVEICVDTAFTAKYPVEKPAPGASHWEYVPFPEGCQTLDGQKALIYARFRSITKGPAYLASDFSRGRRQQQVIEGLKDKALGQDLSIKERAENYWNLLQTMNDNIKYDFGYEDILAGLAFIDSADRDPINVVLDPNFGGLNQLIYGTSVNGMSVIRVRDESYTAIKDVLADVWTFADFHREDPRMVVRNKSGVSKLDDTHITVKLKNETEFYNSIYYLNEAVTDKFYGIKIFDLSAGEKPRSLKYLLDFLGLTEADVLNAEEYGFSKSNHDEDFLIVVGPNQPEPTTSIQPSTTN